MGNTVSNCCQTPCVKNSSSQAFAFSHSKKPLITNRRSKKGKKKQVHFEGNRKSLIDCESSRTHAFENGCTINLENHYSASGMSDDSNICHTDSKSSEIDLSFIEFIADIKSLYAFDKKIGDGKFGTVFLAHPRSDPKSKVAIKLIPQVSFSHRIEKELALLKSIDHLNVIRYISAYRDKAFFYIVTEY
jgi:hypothetical protein